MTFNVDACNNQVELVQLVEQAGGQPKYSSGSYRCACPLHHGDNKGGFSIHKHDGKWKWKCWTNDCGEGDTIDFVMIWQGLDFQAACEWLGGDRQADPAQIAEMAAQRAARAIKELEEAQAKAAKVLGELRQTETWLRYHAAVEADKAKQDLWTAQGIPQDWQNYWQLGYCDKFTCTTDSGLWTTPTMTIPIFTGKNWELQNIRHRLINPPKPNDKYRPERPGLTATPFYCDPELMLDTERVIFIEGEKKAMVTYLTLDTPNVQVIGLPGKNQWRQMLDQLKGKRVYVWLDPDALLQAMEFAKLVNGRYVSLTMKVDDAINEGALDKIGLQRLLRGARMARG